MQVTYTVGPRPKNRIPLKKAMSLAEKIYDRLLPLSDYIVVAGSIRRQRPEIGDIEFVVLPKNLKSFVDFLERNGYFGGNRKRTAIIKNLKIEIYIAHEPEELGAMLFTYTGDYLFNIAMRSIAKRRGWKLDQYGLQDAETGEWILQSPYEEDFFGALGVDYHTPEERSFAHRPRASMGAGPRDWSPRGELPGAKYSKVIKDIQWDGREWRVRDAEDAFTWIWYGPEGKKGDQATRLERTGSGWMVWEYRKLAINPPNVLEVSRWITDDLVAEELFSKHGIDMSFNKDPDDIGPEVWNDWGRWAVGIGAAYIAFYGGVTEKYVESLP